jgi:hypothetical protein
VLGVTLTQSGTVVGFLPVVAARRDDRVRHLTLIVPSLPDSVTNDATGRLTLPLGAKLGRDGRAADLSFAASMTTRASEGRKLL